MLKRGRWFLVELDVMGKQEGIAYLLQAAHHIVFDVGRNDAHFGLVGGGTELEEVKAYASQLGLSDYVTFTGWVPDDDMLNTSDVCVDPDAATEMNDISTMTGGCLRSMTRSSRAGLSQGQRRISWIH